MDTTLNSGHNEINHLIPSRQPIRKICLEPSFFSVQPINSYDIQYETVAERDAFLEVELAVSLTFPFHFFRAAASLSLGLVLMIYM